MDPHTWPDKSRTASTNIHSTTMLWYGMLSRRPAWGDEREGKVAREGQGYPCFQHCMMMMMMMNDNNYFHTSVSWFFFQWISVTASLVMSQGVSLLLWPISTTLLFGWFPISFSFPVPLLPKLNLWLLYRAHQLQLVSLSPSFSIYLFFLIIAIVQVFIFLLKYFQFYPVDRRKGKVR